jgi:putative tryptophan/tyrosine transport system substrate-binding protein
VTTRRHVLSLVFVSSLASARAWGQKPNQRPTVGILSPNSPVGACGADQQGRTVCYFIAGMRALGYIDGSNVSFQYRFADQDYKRLPALAKELVAWRPDVIYTHTGLSADAAAAATTTIPIVVGPAGETSLTRLAGNLARPTTNVTGTALNAIGQDEKCLELLKELAPRITRVAVLLNPSNFDYRGYPSVLRAAAARSGMTLSAIEVRNVSDLQQAFAIIEAKGAEAILLTADPLLTASDEIRPRVNDWAASHRLPLASPSYRVAPGGGLFSLSTDIEAPARRAAFYVHRILNGAKPADLPVELPTKFKLVVNRKTAVALGLVIPQSVLMRADELIE